MKRITAFSFALASLLVIIACSNSKKTASVTPISTYKINILKADIPSPKKEMKGMMGTTSITVVYGSPAVKGRNLWGDLVPYNLVWRTGANEATTIEISKDVMVEGKTLPTGKYSLFTIPNPNEWVVIFNKTQNQWGAYDYKQADDVLRVTVTPKSATTLSETLEFSLVGDELIIMWEKLIVPIKIKA